MSDHSIDSDVEDPLNDAVIEDDPNLRRKNTLTVINTNARSLCPKIDSLIACFEELDADIAVVTETWFKDGRKLDDDLSDLELGAGLACVTLNRDPNPATGVAHGGVAVLSRKAVGSFKKIDSGIDNPECFEVLPVIGNLRGTVRKIVILAVYMPPNYNVPKANRCHDYIENVLISIRNKYRDPHIIVAGDFNQWPIQQALAEFVDLREVLVGPTRGDRSIDRIFSNMGRSVTHSGTVPPLETEATVAAQSDHKVAYMTATLPRREAFEWITYTYRHFDDQAKAKFRDWLIMHDWSEVITVAGSNAKANAYQATLGKAMDEFFPLRTSRRKSTDLPWINRAIRRRIRRRKKIYRKEGRSELWKVVKKEVDEMIKKRKKVYMDRKRQQLVDPEANRRFFSLVKSFNSPEKPQTFDVRELRPGTPDGDIAEELARYFNKVSSEFEPLSPDQIPITTPRQLPTLSPHEVSARIRHFRKPKSMVSGDTFPSIMTELSDFFALPLCSIYNEVITTFVWPAAWKTEFVTVIPKTGCPADFSDLRNISCTLLASKILESYVLEWSMEEIATKYNQYGGVRGCSGTHLVLKVWQNILTNLEDRRAATILTSIDYAKAFNRLSFQHCLRAFASKGSSTPILRLLATFLSNRHMTVRVGQEWSVPKEVHGGCPQGSILGVFLFNVTTDDLEEDSTFVSDPGRPEIMQDDGFLNAPADNPEDNMPSDFQADDGEVFSDAASTGSSSEDSFYSARSGDSIGSGIPFTSSPQDRPPSSPDISPVRDGFVFNVRLGSGDFGPRLGRRVIYSSEGDVTPPPEPTTTCLGAWKTTPVNVDKYVDDNLQEDRVNFENATEYVDAESGEVRKTKHVVFTQNVYRHIVRRAEMKGMKVNSSKTSSLCISDAQNFTPEAFFLDSDGIKITTGKKLKMLGWHFGPRPNPDEYIRVLSRRFRERYWMLRHLKHNGFGQEDLVKVYTSVVRPVADYMMEVYHSMLSDIQDQAIERLQNHALKCIFGARISGRRMRELADITTLRQRRIEAVDKFAAKCVESDRFSSWFPRTETGGRSRRHRDEFVEEYARCNRLYNSPLFYMRRRMNGKPGKEYGSRNKECRED